MPNKNTWLPCTTRFSNLFRKQEANIRKLTESMVQDQEPYRPKTSTESPSLTSPKAARAKTTWHVYPKLIPPHRGPFLLPSRIQRKYLVPVVVKLQLPTSHRRHHFQLTASKNKKTYLIALRATYTKTANEPLPQSSPSNKSPYHRCMQQTECQGHQQRPSRRYSKQSINDCLFK